MICAEIADQRVVRDSCLRTVRPLIRLASPPVGDEVAPFSAARHSAELVTNAFISPRSFGCGCAALRISRDRSESLPNRRVVSPELKTGGRKLRRLGHPAGRRQQLHPVVHRLLDIDLCGVLKGKQHWFRPMPMPLDLSQGQGG